MNDQSENMHPGVVPGNASDSPRIVRSWRSDQDGTTSKDIAAGALPERLGKEEIALLVLENTPEYVLCPPGTAIFGVHRTTRLEDVLSILVRGLRSDGSNIDETVSMGAAVFDEAKRRSARESNAELIAIDHDPMQIGTGLASRYAIIVNIPDGNFDPTNPSRELPGYVRGNIERAKTNRFGGHLRSYADKASCFLQRVPGKNRSILPPEYIVGVVDRRTGVYTPKSAFLAQHSQPSV